MRNLQNCLDVNTWPRASSTVPECMNLWSCAFVCVFAAANMSMFSFLATGIKKYYDIGETLGKGSFAVVKKGTPKVHCERETHTERQTEQHISPHPTRHTKPPPLHHTDRIDGTNARKKNTFDKHTRYLLAKQLNIHVNKKTCPYVHIQLINTDAHSHA